MTPGMNASIALAPANEESVEARAAVGEQHRGDVLFVLACLAVGGSERKIARMANRLKDDGMAVSLACLNGPYTLESGLRRDLPVHKLERRGKLSLGAIWKLRRIIRKERPATVASVNLYSSLYVACATVFMRDRPRTVALIIKSAR